MNKINLKKLIIDIVIVIVSICIIIGIFLYLNHKKESETFDKDNIGGKISFIVYYKDNEIVIDEELEFTDGETLYNILSRNHDIETLESIGVGKGILSIDSYTSSWTSDYFSIYIDGVYSNSGTEMIKAKDEMEVKLIWVKVS